MKVRNSPSGAVLFTMRNGAVLQLAQSLIACGSGDFGTTAVEVSSNMPAAETDLRPELTSPDESSRFFIEGDIDLMLSSGWASQDVITSVEVSRDDGATWQSVGGANLYMPSNTDSGAATTQTRVHVKLSCPDTAVAAISGYEPGDNLLARATVRAGSSPTGGAVANESAGQSSRLCIRELLNE